MSLKWTDIYSLAVLLDEAYPEADRANLSHADIIDYVRGLDEFDGHPFPPDEDVTQDILAAWIAHHYRSIKN